MQFAVGCEYLHLRPRSQEFIENCIKWANCRHSM